MRHGELCGVDQTCDLGTCTPTVDCTESGCPRERGEVTVDAGADAGVEASVVDASTDAPIVHSGYQAFRVPLLGSGVDLYEVRPVPGRPVARGKHLSSPSSGLYALHAKVFVFDRERVFVGSMNLDSRSLRINTELGLIIDSPELARQIAVRVADIAQPANSYVLAMSEADAVGRSHLVWRTLEHGMPVTFNQEPAAATA